MKGHIPGGLLIHGVIAISFLGAAAIVAITVLRPNHDNTTLIVSVLGFLGPTVAALLSLARTIQTGAAVEELRVQINGRLSELLAQTERAAKSEGREEGKAAAADVVALPVVKTVSIAPVVSTPGEAND